MKQYAPENRRHTLRHIAAIAFVGTSVIMSGCGFDGGGNYVDQDGTLHGRVSLSGAFALYPLAVKWGVEFRNIHPDVKVEIDGGGAGKGMTDALTGQVDFGMVSRELNAAEIIRGAYPIPVAKDAVIPSISQSNPYYDKLMSHGLSREAATDIWVNGKIKTWGALLGTDDDTPINIFTRSDACGAAETWASWLGAHQEDLLGEGLNGDPCVVSAIIKDAKSIGYNNIGYAYDCNTMQPTDGIRPLPIDVNSNGRIDPEELFYEDKTSLTQAIADGRYPTPPGRNLYLVSRGVPTDPVVKAFIEFVITEGQGQNADVGYISISESERRQALDKLGK